MATSCEIFSDLPELKTERLLLRKIFLSDAENIFEYARVPVVSKYLSWRPHVSIENSKEFICALIQNYIDGAPASWGIEIDAEKKLIGTIGFLYWDEENQRAEVGFALSDKYWNKGIMTEALWKILSFGFTRMNLNRIEARTFIENNASQRVLEKTGMVYEGTLREHALIKGCFKDLKLYSILKKEFFR